MQGTSSTSEEDPLPLAIACFVEEMRSAELEAARCMLWAGTGKNVLLQEQECLKMRYRLAGHSYGPGSSAVMADIERTALADMRHLELAVSKRRCDCSNRSLIVLRVHYMAAARQSLMVLPPWRADCCTEGQWSLL